MTKKFVRALAVKEYEGYDKYEVVEGREVTLPSFPELKVYAYKKHNKHNREYAWIVVDVKFGRSIDYGYPLKNAIDMANQRMLRHLPMYEGSFKLLWQDVESKYRPVPTVEEVESNG
jgi:hypothetical protein